MSTTTVMTSNLSGAEVAKLAGVHPDTIRSWVSTQRYELHPTKRMGKHGLENRYDVHEVKNLLMELGRVSAAASLINTEGGKLLLLPEPSKPVETVPALPHIQPVTPEVKEKGDTWPWWSWAFAILPWVCALSLFLAILIRAAR
jgi:hypothetical protein